MIACRVRSCTNCYFGTGAKTCVYPPCFDVDVVYCEVIILSNDDILLYNIRIINRSIG